MALTEAGITAILQAGEAVTVWAGIGDGDGSGDQTSNERLQVTLDAAAGDLTATNVPLAYTGDPAAGATHVLMFNDEEDGAFFGSAPTTGDGDFNSAGEYGLTALVIEGSSDDA